MTLGPRPRLTLELTAITAALLLSPAAFAQATAPSANNGLERAQKAADAVFHWIKLNGEKGASRQAPAAAPTPPAAAPPAAAPAPRRPAPVAAAPRPAPPPVLTPAPAPAERAAYTPPESAAPAFAAAPAAPESQLQADSAPVMLAAATPTPAPDAPLAVAERAAEPPPPPQEEEAEVPLKLLSRVNPAIPAQLQRQSFRDGYARVKFTVAADGSVSKAETIKTSHGRLGTAAVDAVKQWRFAPIPTAREVAIEFAFNNLED